MSDSFLEAIKQGRAPKAHSERAHAKFSASASERWFNCTGSVELCEKATKKENKWAKEGTEAHELLEKIMKAQLAGDRVIPAAESRHTMTTFVWQAANFILKTHAGLEGSELLLETRVHLDFIHKDAFGTFDAAIVDHFGTLHVIDFKYGKYPVPADENLQMLFYGIGLAHGFYWNFKKARLTIIQPRVASYEGPIFWDVPILELKKWVGVFEQAIERVLKFPNVYTEGPWCHFCDAKDICPLKQDAKLEKARKVFSNY